MVDGRPAAASRTRFPRADAVVLCRPEQARDLVPLSGDTVAVVMTHNYRNDLWLLELLLPSPVRYLGLLGPKPRSERLLQELEEAGLNVTLHSATDCTRRSDWTSAPTTPRKSRSP